MSQTFSKEVPWLDGGNGSSALQYGLDSQADGKDFSILSALSGHG
jgi:hypothetical protein